MPIIVPENGGDLCLSRRLEAAGVPVISESVALAQDIRPARIGILNLMPAASMEATEIQWLEWFGREPVLQIEPVLMKFDGDKRERAGSKRQDILRRYKPFSEAVADGLDGLIITGDNLEIKEHAGLSGKDALPFQDISYYRQLQEVIDWANNNVRSTIYSCLAAHFALNYLYGLPRIVGNKKIFGVFDHEVQERDSAFVRGMNDSVRAPHSRWGNTPVKEVGEIKQLKILAVSPRVGWLALEQANNAGGADLFLQGHPEYDRLGLHSEFVRDQATGLAVPPNYYCRNSPTDGNVMQTWTTDARVLHANWLGEVYRLFSKPADQQTAQTPH